ncbi:hypothetical protein SISNIDRAFT_436199, partial [Sistotremastrum niveocremeum HHB9708]
MTWKTRNAHYLRISSHSVMPLYLYLDHRHTEWMSDRILQQVLADLRPLINPKLREEKDVNLSSGGLNGKRGTVDVHRGDTYQFAFFFRKVEPHSVLIKTRQFVDGPPKPEPKEPEIVTPATTSSNTKKRKRATKKSAKTSSRRSRAVQFESEEEEEIGDIQETSSSDDERASDATRTRKAPRRSNRQHKTSNYIEASDEETETPMDATAEERTDDLRQDDAISEEPNDRRRRNTHTEVIHIDVDEPDEKKIKPILQLRYQGFSIYDRCLCVILEPWPPLRELPKPRFTSVVPVSEEVPTLRGASVTPRSGVPDRPAMGRSQTPLFLPDDDYRRSVTPAPGPSAPSKRVLPPVPLFHESLDDSEEEDDSMGMMQLSQVLHNIGERAGSVDEEDENDGTVFMGDADERRSGF